MSRHKTNTVRIIGGRWRSRLLEFPDVAGLRPSPDRVRETLFNWLGQNLDGWHCLDLFAGSGALGFEALSRGAESVVMVERHFAALRTLEENARRLKATNLQLVRANALEFARDARSRFDLVFLDPPFALGLQAQALALLPSLLSPGGQVYLESDAAFEAPAGWIMLKRGRAGNVYFHLLGRESDDQGCLSWNV